MPDAATLHDWIAGGFGWPVDGYHVEFRGTDVWVVKNSGTPTAIPAFQIFAVLPKPDGTTVISWGQGQTTVIPKL